MELIQRISSGVNTQTLSTTTRQQLIDSCRRLLRQAEVSAELGPSLAAELPEFKSFSKQALLRLANLVGAHRQEKAGVLQECDPLTLTIVGLSVSTRKLQRMDAEDVTEILSQALSLKDRNGKVFLRDRQIQKVIQEHGSEAFKRGYQSLVMEDVFSKTFPQVDVQFEGSQCHLYTIPHGTQFCSMTAFAISGTVTAYIPIIPVDCCVRFTTLFNEDLFRSLFGYQLSACDIGPLPLLALKDQVASTLGEDTFSAIQTSFIWAKGTNAATTECVKGVVYIGHVIVVDVMMNRNVCIEWVNSAIGT